MLKEETKHDFDKIAKSILFYNLIRQSSNEQYKRLLSCSRVRSFPKLAKILSQDSKYNEFYYLASGRLVISLIESDERKFIGHIEAGNVFGDLSLLLQRPRIADVHVKSDCNNAIVVAVDGLFFGATKNVSNANLKTKIIYYKYRTNTLRAQLELNRKANPAHELADQHRKIAPTLLNGSGTMEQLKAIHFEAKALAELLIRWNPITAKYIVQKI